MSVLLYFFVTETSVQLHHTVFCLESHRAQKVFLCGAVCILSLKLRLKNKGNQIWVWNSSSGLSSLTCTVLNRVWRVNLFFFLHVMGCFGLSLRSFKYFQ